MAEPDVAARSLAAAGLELLDTRAAVLVPLAADVPGELGRIMARLADSGIRVDVQYSDHTNQKVLVVDDPDAARRVLQ